MDLTVLDTYNNTGNNKAGRALNKHNCEGQKKQRMKTEYRKKTIFTSSRRFKGALL